MKLKTILFNVALAAFTICSVGRIAASQMSNPSSTPTGQEASQPVPLDQQALAWIKKLSEATVTEQTLEEASKFHQENLGTLSDERFQELSHAIADKESETARRVLRDASLMVLTIEARTIPYLPLGNSWLNVTTQPAKTIKFVNTPDLVALIAHVTEKEKKEIESYLQSCSSNEPQNTLYINETQYEALYALSELDRLEEPTVDSLKKSLVEFKYTDYYPKVRSEYCLLRIYQLCLKALIKTKNAVQQEFSYDHWLKALALYYVELGMPLALCSDELFINQQDQKLSLAQWIINNSRLSEVQEKELLKAERAAVQEREKKAHEQARREKEEKAEQEALSEARTQSQPQIQPDTAAPMAEQQSPDLLPETGEQADALSFLGLPLPETSSATSAAEAPTKGGIGEAVEEYWRKNPEAYKRSQERERAYEREKNSISWKCRHFVYRHPWVTYTAGVIIGAAAIYGGYRWYKHINVSKLARAAGKWA